MDKNMKKAILKNRVKLMNLDYFDLSGPLLASEIFPSKKHKEIKTQANDSKARVDLLLEWLEDSAPKEAFPIFLNGIRNCKELILAKKIKREASGKDESDGKPKTTSNLPLDQLLAGIIPTLPASLPSIAAAAGKAKKPKAPKAPKTNAPAAGPAPINGLPSSTNLLPPPPPPVTKKRKAEGGDAKQKQPKLKLPKPKAAAAAASGAPAAATKATTPKTPKAKGAANKQNGAPKTDGTAGSRSSTPKSAGAAIAAAAAAAAAKAAAAMAAAATPRATRKSSSSDTVQGNTKAKAGGRASAAKKGKPDKKDAAAGPAAAAGGSSPKRSAPTRGAAMTFKEVEDKQQDFKNKFKFTNSDAVAKVIHFKDKSDITYLGCPFMVNNKQCGKKVRSEVQIERFPLKSKVELKSKEFICEAKHKNPNCRQIPRLLVTFNDGTADLVLTLMRQNVENFSGKSESDIESMTVDEIKGVLEKAVGKKINVEVNSEKAKKQGPKKGSAVKWNNVATIIDESSEEPPNKKKRTK